jgi:hypothetical protein
MSNKDKWRVEVHENAEMILVIEDDSLYGVDDIDQHSETVVKCAEHLLAFIGKPDPSMDKWIEELEENAKPEMEKGALFSPINPHIVYYPGDNEPLIAGKPTIQQLEALINHMKRCSEC